MPEDHSWCPKVSKMFFFFFFLIGNVEIIGVWFSSKLKSLYKFLLMKHQTNLNNANENL